MVKLQQASLWDRRDVYDLNEIVGREQPLESNTFFGLESRGLVITSDSPFQFLAINVGPVNVAGFEI
jgi:hypothetical protein